MLGKCILIAAGDLTMGNVKVTEQDFVIAVDGGLSYCPVLEVEPDLIIGDFDSVNAKEKEAILTLSGEIPERVVTLPTRKDDTDLLAAIKYGLEKGYREFHIYAGMGGRFDHSFANIQCLLYLKRHGAVGYLLDGTGMILVLCNESVSFQKNLAGTVSIFALGEKATGVTIRGMKYGMEQGTISNDFPIGISNEFIGEQAYVAVEEGDLVCIIQYEERE